jgi:hypothetical protein
VSPYLCSYFVVSFRIEGVDLLRSEVLTSVLNLFGQGDMSATAIVFQGIERPGAETRHAIVLFARYHSPEIKRQDSFGNNKEGAEWISLCSSWER